MWLIFFFCFYPNAEEGYCIILLHAVTLFQQEGKDLPISSDRYNIADPILLCWQTPTPTRVIAASTFHPRTLTDETPQSASRTVSDNRIFNSNCPKQHVKATENASQSTKVKKCGKFRSIWLNVYPWLRYDTVQNIMYCTYCRRWSHELTASRSSFIKGNRNFRSEIVNHHDKCKAHQFCKIREMSHNITSGWNIKYSFDRNGT